MQHSDQVWWPSPVIPTLGRLRQENRANEASLGYRVNYIRNKTV